MYRATRQTVGPSDQKFTVAIFTFQQTVCQSDATHVLPLELFTNESAIVGDLSDFRRTDPYVTGGASTAVAAARTLKAQSCLIPGAAIRVIFTL